MRAISIRGPAALAIAEGRKTTERRSRRLAAGPLLILSEGKAVCVVELTRVTGSSGEYAWHLARPRWVEPFATRSYGWIVHVDDRRIRERKGPPELAAALASAAPATAARRTRRRTRPRRKGAYALEVRGRTHVAGLPSAKVARIRGAALARRLGEVVELISHGFLVDFIAP